MAARCIGVERQDVIGEQTQQPSNASASIFLRLPVGSAPMPNSSSASVTLDRNTVSADWAFSQARTAVSGTGFMASDTTFVSRTII
jgi:hypothetical protein